MEVVKLEDDNFLFYIDEEDNSVYIPEGHRLYKELLDGEDITDSLNPSPIDELAVGEGE